MEKDIIENSKLIAEYLGWKYIPFNDLQGFKKAGWYKVETITPIMIKVRVPSPNHIGHIDKEMDVSLINFSKKGWSRVGNQAIKFICRTHTDLRFYNSMDALLPVIKKIEGEDLGEYFYTYFMQKEKRYNFNNIEFTLSNNGAYSVINWELDPCTEVSANFIEGNTWIQNTFQTVSETIRYITEIKTRKK